MVHAPVAFFDFDGTIADSLEQVVVAYNSVAPGLGIPTITGDEAMALRRMRPREALRAYGIPLWKVPRIMTAVRGALRSSMAALSPFPGMVQAVRALCESGVRCCILSSNSRENIEAFLAHHALDVFEVLSCGASMFGKATHIRKLVRRLAVERARVFYVGDEVRDVVAAKEAGVRSVAVTWGYSVRSALKAEEPDFVVDAPDELVALFQRALPCATG